MAKSPTIDINNDIIELTDDEFSFIKSILKTKFIHPNCLMMVKSGPDKVTLTFIFNKKEKNNGPS